MSRKGGFARPRAAVPSIEPLGEDPALANLDPSTAQGLRDCVSAGIKGLLRLPFDVRVANAIGVLATAQRSIIETSDIERRVALLEQRTRPPTRLAG